MAVREELFYDSRDESHKIRALKWKPEGEVKCILQIIHGMAEHIERYDAFANYMADHGVLVVANDHLGHGKSVKSKDEYGFFCEEDPLTVVVRDVHRLKKLTQEIQELAPAFCLGKRLYLGMQNDLDIAVIEYQGKVMTSIVNTLPKAVDGVTVKIPDRPDLTVDLAPYEVKIIR